jgi:alpha-tubulin suppressor-like RCC1 family protein
MGYHTAIIGTDSSLWTFGYNDYGQLGHTNTVSRSSPVQVGTDTNWSAVSTGGSFTLAIKSGALWGWGDGTIPDNSYSSRSSPIQIGSLTNWSKIAAGPAFGAAVKTDGSLWTWGTNYMGTLGLNLGYAADKSSPTQVGGLYTWASVAAGRKQTFAVKTDGTLWAFGYNNYGQLGNNSIANTSSPVQIGSDTNWSKVNAGYFTTFAIKTNGTMWSWGRNDDGQLGQNNLTNISSPVQIGSLSTWSNIAGNYSTVATKNDGTLWSWSSNDQGNLGLGDTVPRSSPVQIGSDTDWSKLGSNLKTNAAINTAGELYIFGDNEYGQLGINSVADASSPTQVGAQIYGWIDADVGGDHIGAIRADGTLWTWGRAQAGQTGQNTGAPTPIQRSSPVQVGTDTNWLKIKNQRNGMMAIKTDGTLWAWGYQDQGQLGDNSTIPRSSPVQIGALTDWSLISSGDYMQHAIRTNGTLYGWGRNNSNATSIGDNTRVDRSSPVQIGSDTWSTVATGMHIASAIKTNGTLWAWGAAATSGATGQNDRIDRSSPVQIGTNTNWISTAVGGSTEGTQFILATANTPF